VGRPFRPHRLYRAAERGQQEDVIKKKGPEMEAAQSSPVRTLRRLPGAPQDYLFSAKSQTLQLRYMPPAMPISRFFIRFTTRVGLPHSGQGAVSTLSTFLARSAVFAFSAIGHSFVFRRWRAQGPSRAKIVIRLKAGFKRTAG